MKVKLENPPIVSIKENPLGTIIPHLIPLPWRYTIVAFFSPSYPTMISFSLSYLSLYLVRRELS